MGFLQLRNVAVSETSVCLAKCHCRHDVTRSFKLVHQMIAKDHCHFPTALQPRSTAGIHLACGLLDLRVDLDALKRKMLPSENQTPIPRSWL